MNEKDNESTALAIAERLPADLMLLKMENESIMAVARAVPRDPMKIVAQLQALIDAYPAAADEAIYSKPVGTVIEVTCAACGVKYEVTRIETDTVCPACDSPKHGASRKIKKFAEGLSIRAAESIRSIFGYTRLATTTEVLDDGKVKLTGVLVDYAAGNVTSDERIVSPMYRSRSGAMTRTPEDRFLNVVVKAEKAKLRRDVILDSTPNIIKACFRDACEKKLEELVAPEVIDQKIIPAFAQYGITLQHLERLVGRPRALGWRQTERMELRKILTALKAEETTVKELLDGLDDRLPETSIKPATGPVKAEDLMPTHPHQAAEEAAAREVAAGPAGTTPAVAEEEQAAQEPAEPDLIAQLRKAIPEAPTVEHLREFGRIIKQCGESGEITVKQVGEFQAAIAARQKTLQPGTSLPPKRGPGRPRKQPAAPKSLLPSEVDSI